MSDSRLYLLAGSPRPSLALQDLDHALKIVCGSVARMCNGRCWKGSSREVSCLKLPSQNGIKLPLCLTLKLLRLMDNYFYIIIRT